MGKSKTKKIEDNTDKSRLKELLNKNYKMTVMSSANSIPDYPRLLTGIFAFDYISGGGVPRGKITSLFGNKSSGKTFVCLKTIAMAQKTCRLCNQVMEKDLSKPLNTCMSCGMHTKESHCPSCKDNFGADIETEHRGHFERFCNTCKENSSYRVFFMDLEGTWDNGWCAKIGVDTSTVILARPEYGEMAVDILDQAVRSGEYDLIVLDSVAYLSATSELENSSEKQQQGVNARLCNKMWRKLQSGLNSGGLAINHKPVVLVINQLRQKIGVMFGCFEYNARVSLADGTVKKIGEIVKNRLPIEVMTVVDGKVVPRKVIGWHENGDTEKWLKFQISRNGRMSQFKCTPNHIIFTPKGKVSAGSLNKGDLVISKYKKSISQEGLDLILGMTLGDGSISLSGKAGATLRMTHGGSQSKYCQWKASLLGDLVTINKKYSRGMFGSYKRKDVWVTETRSFPELRQIRKLFYRGKQRIFTSDIADRLTALHVAIWYLDDGCISKRKKWGKDRGSLCISAFDKTSKDCIKKFFIDRGIECEIHGKSLMFTPIGFEFLQKDICKYVIPSMQYKLSECFQNKYVKPFVEVKDSGIGLSTFEILNIEEIEVLSKAGHRKNRVKYNITVEDGKCYFVSDVLVKNSPDVLPGGKGQDFAKSLELKLWAGKPEQDEEGNTIVVGSHLKVSKSKIGPTLGMESSFKYFIDDAQGKLAGDTDCFQTVMKIAELRGDIGKSPDGKVWRSHTKQEFKTKKALFEFYSKKEWRTLYSLYLKMRVGNVGSYAESSKKK